MAVLSKIYDIKDPKRRYAALFVFFVVIILGVFLLEFEAPGNLMYHVIFDYDLGIFGSLIIFFPFFIPLLLLAYDRKSAPDKTETKRRARVALLAMLFSGALLYVYLKQGNESFLRDLNNLRGPSNQETVE